MELRQPPAASRRLPGGVLALAVIILLAAAFVRFYRLSEVLPGLGDDEALEVIEALNFAQHGTIPITVWPHGTEVLSRMVQGVLFIFIGPYPFVGRLTLAFWGVLAVALTFRAARSLFRHLPARDAAALAAAAALGGFSAFLVLSRSVFRGGMLPAAMAAAILMLARAWHTGRRRDFALAGLLWSGCALVYLPGLFMLPAMAAILLHQSAFNWRSMRRRLPQIGILLGAMVIPMLAVAALEIGMPGPLYFRLGDASARAAREPEAANLLRRYFASFRGVYKTGGLDPKRSIADAPLLNPALVALALLGVLVCLTRLRRLAAPVLLSLSLLMVLPLTLGDALIDGLRMAGIFVPAALLVGLGGGQIVATLRAEGGRAAAAIGALALAWIVVWSGIGSFRAFFSFYDNPDQWRTDHERSFVWYFLTAHVDLAERLNTVDQPTYLTLDEYYGHTTRFILAARYPRVISFSERAGPGEPLNLPDGQIVLPAEGLEGPPPAAYVLLLPRGPGQRGTVILLPALDEAAAAALRDRAVESGEAWHSERSGLLGYRLPLQGAENPFAALSSPLLEPLATFDGGLQLMGWEGPRTLIPGSRQVVTLYWRAERRQPTDVYLYVHLLDRSATGLTSGGDDVIGRWSHSPRIWRRGAIVPETRTIDVPDGLAPGPYGLLIGVYRPFEEDSPLTVTGPAGEDLGVSYQLWPLKVAAPPTAIPEDLTPTDVTLGGFAELAGYRLTREGQPAAWEDLAGGQTFTLTLYWQALTTTTASNHIFVHVESPDGAMLTASDGPPQEGAYPTPIWDMGEVVATAHTLTLPPDADAFSVRLGMYSWPDLTRLPAVQDGERTPDDRVTLWAP